MSKPRLAQSKGTAKLRRLFENQRCSTYREVILQHVTEKGAIIGQTVISIKYLFNFVFFFLIYQIIKTAPFPILGSYI